MTGLVLWDCGGFGLGVELVDLGAVTVFDYAAAQLHGWGEGAVVGGEFIGDDHDSLQLFEASETLIHVLDDSFVEALNLGIRDEIGARVKWDVIVSRPFFQQGEIWERL